VVEARREWSRMAWTDSTSCSGCIISTQGDSFVFSGGFIAQFGVQSLISMCMPREQLFIVDDPPRERTCVGRWHLRNQA